MSREDLLEQIRSAVLRLKAIDREKARLIAVIGRQDRRTRRDRAETPRFQVIHVRRWPAGRIH